MNASQEIYLKLLHRVLVIKVYIEFLDTNNYKIRHNLSQWKKVVMTMFLECLFLFNW